MTEFFTSVLDFFKTLSTFISTLISGTVQFFHMITGVMGFSVSAVHYLPTFLTAFFVLTIYLLVIKIILDLL